MSSHTSNTWHEATQQISVSDTYPAEILPGADFNRFKGIEKDLADAWPSFSKRKD